ncbi:MAG: hypothetical protein RRC34_16035 [Lentisphaeria bacterium]|nr:hypothetical protein [Lentisphaeria bacterium]
MASLLEIAGINEKNLADGVSCALIPSHSPLAPGHSITVVKTVQDDTIKDYRFAHGRFTKDGVTYDCPCPDHPAPIEGPVERDITYVAPFTKCDREDDYREVWAEFKERMNEE